MGKLLELLKAPAPALRQRLLSGSVWAFAGKMVAALAQLAVGALLARLLSPRDMGAYFLAFSLVSLGALAGSSGISQAGVRFIAESVGLDQYGRMRRVVGMVLVFGVLGASCVGFAYLLFGHVLGTELFRSPALAAVTGLVAAWMAVTSLQGLLAETFRGFHDIRLTTVFGGSVTGGGLLTGAMLVASLGLLLLLEKQTTLAVVLVPAIGSGLITVLLAGMALRRKVVSFARRDTPEGQIAPSEVLRVVWPLLVTNVVLFAVTQADLWIMGAFRPQEEVAVYGAAARVVFLVSMPLQVANAVIPPLIAEMYSQGKRRALERVLRATATLAGIPALLVLIVLVLLGGPVLGEVYGEYYRGGAAVLTLLSLGQLVNVWVGSCGMTLGMTGHQSALMVITVACAAITIVVGLGVVDQYGATGVAAATAGGLTLQNLSMWLAARFTTGMWTHAVIVSLPGLVKSVIKRGD